MRPPFVSSLRLPLLRCLYLVSEEATRNGFFGFFVDSRVTPPRRGKGTGKGGVPATSPRSSPRVAFVRTFNAFRRNARIAPRAPVAPPRGRLCESEVKASSECFFATFFSRGVSWKNRVPLPYFCSRALRRTPGLFFPFPAAPLEKSCAFTFLLEVALCDAHAGCFFSPSRLTARKGFVRRE